MTTPVYGGINRTSMASFVSGIVVNTATALKITGVYNASVTMGGTTAATFVSAVGEDILTFTTDTPATITLAQLNTSYTKTRGFVIFGTRLKVNGTDVLAGPGNTSIVVNVGVGPHTAS